MAEATTLYKHYDAEEVPIYYGISGQNEKRQSQHDPYSLWTEFSARCEVQGFASREEAKAAEEAAIEADRPIFNRAHNGADCIDRAVEYLAKKERYDLLQPRSMRFNGPRHSPEMVAHVESLPRTSAGRIRIESSNMVYSCTEEEMYALLEHGIRDCPCPAHRNQPLNRYPWS